MLPTILLKIIQNDVDHSNEASNVLLENQV